MNEEKLKNLLLHQEDYDLEFKTAANAYNEMELVDYCAAISNEGDGYLLLGVANDGRIVGTKAFSTDWNKLAHKINSQLLIRVMAYEVICPEGRVLAFKIPKHFPGVPVHAASKSKYKYPIRDGESLVEMSTETLKVIYAETIPDWSAAIAEGVAFTDLSQQALRRYRSEWAKHAHKPEREQVNLQKMLLDLRLMKGEQITNAALLLFGKESVLSNHIPDAEIVFEWRNKRQDIAFADRRNFRSGFIAIQDELWNTVNARNTIFRYQSGFTQREIPGFDEDSIREAIVNAFTHRDYTVRGRSILIKACPDMFEIENPGMLMPGVTLDNILDETVWRNRLLAESLEKAHLMERSSQGVDKIYSNTISSGKGIPLYALKLDPAVTLSIPAVLLDQGFVGFLERISQKTEHGLSVKEIIELESIRQRPRKSNELQFKERFLDMGIIERVGSKGRGSSYILAHQYYVHTGDTGKHTRLSGLSREVKVEIILKHLDENGSVTNAELQAAMPDMDMTEINTLLRSMGKEGKITHVGSRRYGHWVVGREKTGQLNLLDID